MPADTVYVTNPTAGAVHLPVIGVIMPGVNAVEAAAYDKTVDRVEEKDEQVLQQKSSANGQPCVDENGNAIMERVIKRVAKQVKGCIDWKTLGFQVRDERRQQGPKDLTEGEAVAFMLACNDAALLESFKAGEKRKKVLAAIDRQIVVLTLDQQSIAKLKAVMKIEERPQIAEAIERAIAAKEKGI